MIKILIDENLPQKLKYRFGEGFQVLTVNDMGWTSMKNGELMKQIDNEKFDYLLTGDRNIEYQQNIENIRFKLIILIVPNNRYETILPYVDKIKLALHQGRDKIIRL